MAPDSELYDWRDRSDIRKMLPANASSLRWCSGNKKGVQKICISRGFLQCLLFITTLRKYLCRLAIMFLMRLSKNDTQSSYSKVQLNSLQHLGFEIFVCVFKRVQNNLLLSLYPPYLLQHSKFLCLRSSSVYLADCIINT